MTTVVRRLLMARPWLSLALLGSISALAHAPFYWVWLLPLCFAPALWLAAKRRSALGVIGAVQWFALGHFAAGMYWLAAPLFVAPENVPLGLVGSVIGTPIAVLGIPAVIALCFALPVGLTLHWLNMTDRAGGWFMVLLVALAWACGDWLRSWVLTGLPWNLTAYVWGWSATMMQSVAWIGPYGLSFLTALVALAPMQLIDQPQRWRSVFPMMIGVLLALWAAGIVRTAALETAVVRAESVTVGLIQPAGRQHLGRTRDEMYAAVDDLLALSSDVAEQVDLVIWSEGATGLELYRDFEINNRVRQFTENNGPAIITGSTKVAFQNHQAGDLGGRYRATNSLSLIQDGSIQAEHDKAHLVPFGEYMPLRRLLTLPNLSLPGGDFAKGPGVQTIRQPGVPDMSPLICYEAIFPGRVVDRMKRPTWMVNITTDAWFGNTTGPHQHLTSVRFRAVEEGLPLVRVAGAGISAVVDPFGRVEASIGHNQRGSLAVALPGYLEKRPLFSAGGQIVVVVVFWLFLFWVTVASLGNLRLSRVAKSNRY